MPTLTSLLLSENVFVDDIKYTKGQGIIVFPITPMESRVGGGFWIQNLQIHLRTMFCVFCVIFYRLQSYCTNYYGSHVYIFYHNDRLLNIFLKN